MELSDYQHANILEESTIRQMPVPQGPGIAMQFLEDLAEESTCFTANFQHSSNPTTQFQTKQSHLWSMDSEFDHGQKSSKASSK